MIEETGRHLGHIDLLRETADGAVGRSRRQTRDRILGNYPHATLRVSEVTELRISVPETGRRLLPLPVAAWHATIGAQTIETIAKGDSVLVHGQLVRRFYRSGAGARSLTEVVATGIKRLDPASSANEKGAVTVGNG